MRVRTIRDVDEETWRIIRELAERKNVKIGMLLKLLVKNYRKTEMKEIIPKTPILSKKEAVELKTFLKELRKEYGFRA